MSEPSAGEDGLLNPEELDPNARKGKLGELVVALIAVTAGFLVAKADPDRDGIDLTISSRNSPYPKLDFQVKCTQDGGDDPVSLVYRLGIDHYHRLRAASLAPRFLAVLVVPNRPGHWLRHDRRKLTIRRCCYWTGMSGLPEVSNAQSVAVTIPRSNLLTGEALSALMEEARQEARP